MFEKRTTPPQSMPGQQRVPYDAPRLVVYGSLAEITRVVGAAGKNDGGSPPMQRSQP